MASGMVPIRLLRDQAVTSDEVMVYLSASVLSGKPFDMSEIALLARLDFRDAQRATLSLLASGHLTVERGVLILGPLGGDLR